jgi:hypothetical protein
MFILHLKHLQLRQTNSRIILSFGSKPFQVRPARFGVFSFSVVLTLHNLRSIKLSGAKVLRINGEDPFVAVNENTKITGSYQAFGTRQNSYEFFFLHGPGMKFMCPPVSFRATAVAQP